jgi:hypothetical protein
MESQMKRIHMLGLKRPLALSLVLPFSTCEKYCDVTFAIDGDFDAGRRRRGRASGSSYLYPASSVLAPAMCENQCDALECPSFALNFARRRLAH